ncbi:TraY domain-containing protein [Hafnia paralvei]|uniref:TraY domain-containing protein n=1 Tax=Hafnia TaxID=568 RepID=UPI001FFE4BAC|nr:TraY domain-containing protein [Hafnia alvei]MCK2179582.1 TraY domain-containing protein [Hafnia paralvei]
MYLDNETNALLTSTKNRSGRSKSIEVAMRLKDHLLRFPDFYNSEYTEGVPSIKKK